MIINLICQVDKIWNQLKDQALERECLIWLTEVGKFTVVCGEPVNTRWFHWLKVPAIKHEDLSSIHRTHVVESEN